jgi:prepilin-type N-terminal cleavage/methylation domain-containing protein
MRSGAKKRESSPFTEGGFTLFELVIVLGIFALLLSLELPTVSRLLSFREDFFQEFPLFWDILCEESMFRGEIFYIQWDPREEKFHLVTPLRVGEGVEWEERSDPVLPKTLSLPGEYRFVDLQLLDGEKYSDLPVLLRVFPSGWVDPFTFHLKEKGTEKEITLWIEPFTCRVEKKDGYMERFYQEGS